MDSDLGAVAVPALVVGYWCHFIPTRSAVAIPSANAIPYVRPFWGHVSLRRDLQCKPWSRGGGWSASIVPMIAMWTGGLTIISLFYLPAFDFTRT